MSTPTPSTETRTINVGGKDFTFSTKNLSQARLQGTIFERIALQSADYREFIDADSKLFNRLVAPLIRHGIEPNWGTLNDNFQTAKIIAAMFKYLGLKKPKPTSRPQTKDTGSIPIFVQTANGVKKASAQPHYTVRELRFVLHGAGLVKVGEDGLLLAGRTLEDHEKIEDLFAHGGSVLKTKPHDTEPLLQGGMQVFLKTLEAKTKTFTIPSALPVFYLKLLIEGREGVPAASQRLVFAGRQLEDRRTLSEYNIQKESTLHMVVRLTGD